MPSLRELQRGFAAATIFGDRSAMAGLGIVGGRLDAGARLAIYRNNVLANYRKALAATYPVVQALVGRPFFGAAVEAFVRAHPSRRGDVNRYGGELAQFLGSYAPARELPYLPDVARLEWAIDQAAIAADADRLDLASLAAVPEPALGSLRFALHPSARFIVSRYPIFRIWQANQPGHEEDPRVDLSEGGDALLVVRGAEGVSVQRLSPSTHAFLSSLRGHLTLSQAVDRAIAADASFDLGEALRAHVASQTIVPFRAPSSRQVRP
jgi:hypothetical protein